MDFNEENFNAEWETPDIQELGNAKELVKNQNVVGGGDTQFSVLIPS